MDLQEGEIKMDAQAVCHRNQPAAVRRSGVILWVTGGEDSAIVWCNVTSAGH